MVAVRKNRLTRKIDLSSVRTALPHGFTAVLAAGLIFMVLAAASPAAARLMKLDAQTETERLYLGQTEVFQAPAPVHRVVVSNGKIASARAISKRQILILGKNIGQTHLLLWCDGRTDPLMFSFRVDTDPHLIADAEAMVRRLVPRAHVRILPAHQEVLLEGTVPSVQDMQRVLQIVTPFFAAQMEDQADSSQSQQINMDGDLQSGGSVSQLQQNLNLSLAIRNNLIVVQGPQQVQLEVTIAEVSRSGTKKLGLAFLNNSKGSAGLFPTGETAGRVNGQTDTGSDLQSAATIASPFGAAFQVLYHSIDGDTLGILSLLKGQGLARMLATPTLVAMSGQSASFRVGGDIPIPVTGSDGATNIAYREYGVLLEFVPTVIGPEMISLEVAPEVSSVDWSLGTSSGGVQVPGVKTRTGKTTLQLRDGQSFAMAGLLKEEVSSVVSKVPFLGDIPVLGTLFTSKQYERSESELVIIVTPRLVRPLNPGERKPTSLEASPGRLTDADFFLLNRTRLRSGDPVTGRTGQPSGNQNEKSALDKAGDPAGNIDTPPEFDGPVGLDR